MQKVIRPLEYKYYSDIENESSLRSQIKKGRKESKDSSLFFALLMARNNTELATLRTFAEKCATNKDDEDLKNIVYIVFDEVFGDVKYEQFIEYQANYACASSHNLLDQQKVHRNHAILMVKEWMESVQRNNAIVYINGEESQPISIRHLSSIVNSSISPIIYKYSPDAHELLRQKAPSTFWRQQNSKEIVRTFLFATSKDDFTNINNQMRPIQWLIQDCLDDNMNWKTDVPKNHPFKMVYDIVNSTIKNADKSLPFNFDEKFSFLTKPPYGFYSNYATMGMMAFALKPWVNKIFDPQGKPRDANALTDDIVWLFKVWDDKKSNSKLNFKFQTPEEGKLCKEFTSLFKLNDHSNNYKDISSLKDARYAITAEFLSKKNAPLWAIKYAPDSVFAGLPVTINITEDIRTLTDDIVKICAERELRDTALIKETLTLIDKLRLDMKNILNVDAAFTEGFKSYLMKIDDVNVKEDEMSELLEFIKQHLESTVGYWTEDEVVNKALRWRASKQSPMQPTIPASPWTGVSEPYTPSTNFMALSNKRKEAYRRIESLNNIDAVKGILLKLCEKGNEWVLDIINEM